MKSCIHSDVCLGGVWLIWLSKLHSIFGFLANIAKTYPGRAVKNKLTFLRFG